MSTIIFIVIVLAVVIGAFLLFGNDTQAPSDEINSAASPSASSTPTTSPLVSAGVSLGVNTPKTWTITLTNATVSVNELTIKVGDTVRFTNIGSMLHWPASDSHPTHTICPGFDAKKGLKEGESYAYQFTKAQICGFHDHLDSRSANFSGRIIVVQ